VLGQKNLKRPFSVKNYKNIKNKILVRVGNLVFPVPALFNKKCRKMSDTATHFLLKCYHRKRKFYNLKSIADE
jgi:hypothetical protein